MTKRLPPRYDVPNAAPAPLRLVQELVNTVDHEHGREWLGTPALLRKWLVERSLLPAGARVRRAEWEDALRFREALRELVQAQPGPETERTIASAADAANLSFRITDGGLLLAPEASGVAGSLGRVLVIAFASMADGSWRRLKTCRNCRWAFYDNSRNQSATWCSMQLCGNRLKTRSYYRRRTRAA